MNAGECSRDRKNRNLAFLSVVVPCYNEESVISETHRRLTETLSRIPAIEFEVLYVDDGSRDSTLAILRALQQSDQRVRVVVLSRVKRRPLCLVRERLGFSIERDPAGQNGNRSCTAR
jgi:cellulose synthase/poly-beta-1,6-N-acetylglucosamine synthase-like glycosyltransferase